MWVVFALLTSFFNAAYFLLNQKMAMTASLFMVYRGWAVFFMLLPFAGLFTPVPHWEFYALCMLQGALIAFVDGKFFVALRRWGAEVATSLQPFSIGITFVLWLIISPSTILVYLREPFVALLIVAAMAGIVVSVRLFNRSLISMQALKFLVLTLTVGAFCDIVNKKAMNYGQGDLVSASYFYVLLIALVAGAINLVVYLRDNGSLKKAVVSENVKYLPVFVLLIGCNVSKNFAMFYAFNPSYVAALMYIYILWIALFNMLKARLTPNVPYNRMNVKAALLLLTSAIVLILASG